MFINNEGVFSLNTKHEEVAKDFCYGIEKMNEAPGCTKKYGYSLIEFEVDEEDD